MDIRSCLVLILFLVFLFSTQNTMFSLGMINCKENERTALLSFKQHLKNSSNSLSSWSGENCCRWAGVVCHNTTDHVIQLHLQQLGLGGALNPSLLELKQLTHLNLSLNDFKGISIPDFLGSLQSLRYLILSRANFSGMIPHQLGNLSRLQYLDLSDNNVYGMIPHQLGNLSRLRYLDLSDNFYYGKPDLDEDFHQLSVVGNFQWISNLSSLEHLDLSDVNLENASNWFHVVNMLPSLLALRLSDCRLASLPSLPSVNFTSLAVLDLSFNFFYLNSTCLPEWLYRLSSLEQLSLLLSGFQGTISASIGNLTKLTVLNLNSNRFQDIKSLASIGNLSKLTVLDLFENNLEGEIPTALGNLCKLRRLELSGNKLKGNISGILGSSIGCIADSLESLGLSSNQLSGPLPDELGRLENLEDLSLDRNSFSGSIPFSIGRLTLLRSLDLSSNELNGSVPESFGNLSRLESLYLSYNEALEGIVSEVHFSNLTSLREISLDSVVLKVRPEWIPPFQLTSARFRNCRLGPGFPNWIKTQKLLTDVDLSGNGISGIVPTWFWNFSSQFYYLNLSHNHFNGELPKVFKSSSSGYIYLNSNNFKGPLPRLAPNVKQLDLSHNSFSGPISTLVCNPLNEVNELEFLDVSNNHLSGNLSECWFYWRSLELVKLENNYITDRIPSSMGSLLQLQSLHLQKNNLSGDLPLSLRKCILLIAVDIGENGLTGRLPIWLGESFPGLIVLRLRQNQFHGEIPQELCDLTSLQMLDLAHNNLSGSIPKCFNNFSAMAQNSSRQISFSSYFAEATSLVMKGREFEYSITLALVTNMDLSNNSLSGEIPEELTSLVGLISLNLSENCFTGKIPEKIGNMIYLESLDFSKNKISGVIPQSISGLTFLSHLNLSYNNLSGKIPSSTQLQSLNESCFIGNQELCGPPLKKKCNREQPPQKPDDHIGDTEVEDEDWFEMKWFYMSMGVGFVVGFWVFCCIILLKSSWRIAYFRSLDDVKDKIYVLF